MYFGVVAMLTKGSFALYYGGPEVIPLLSDRAGSMVSPVYMGISLMMQLAFFLFKKFKFRKVLHRNMSSDNYIRELASTLLSGFSNMYSLVAMVTFSAAGCVFTLVHYAIIEKHRAIEADGARNVEDTNSLEKIPFTIYLFSIILAWLNLVQYQRNYALRAFSKKKIKEYFTFLLAGAQTVTLDKHLLNQITIHHTTIKCLWKSLC